jgi:hypothetical protein
MRRRCAFLQDYSLRHIQPWSQSLLRLTTHSPSPDPCSQRCKRACRATWPSTRMAPDKINARLCREARTQVSRQLQPCRLPVGDHFNRHQVGGPARKIDGDGRGVDHSCGKAQKDAQASGRFDLVAQDGVSAASGTPRERFCSSPLSGGTVLQRS